ncbi:MAG: CDP-2,3-bis-(O-geranylgeranyl)-sn-glycerol synthase [Thermoprotei archaeon]
MNPIYVAVALAVPMYAANGSPVLIRGKRPIDFGQNAHDGKRVFGDGKTWEGFIGGVMIGTLVGAIESALWPSLMQINLAFLMSLGALSGDLFAAFLKRRAGLKRGQPAPVLDQLDFVVGALALAWFAGYHFSAEIMLIVLIITPFLHLSTNYLAYLLDLKAEPW